MKNNNKTLERKKKYIRHKMQVTSK